MHAINDARQTKIHTAGLLVPEPIVFEVDMAIKNLKRYHKMLFKFQQN